MQEAQTAPERRRRSDGARTHAAILDIATRLASVEGVHGLTIGRLAHELGVSKSGLYAHFGSKEQLQLQTVEAAMTVFEEQVMRPASQAPPGLEQLEAILEGFFSYVERDVFPGGCFFAALLAEVDAKPGRVHDVASEWERESLEGLAVPLQEAQSSGELAADFDADQVAFELYACMELTNYHFVLFRDPEILERGRRAVRGIVDRLRPAEHPPAGPASSAPT
jgi:AcrR family transcriptional regulator